MGGKVDAVVLAGGINRIRLFPGDRPGYKALARIGGRTFLDYVLAAARRATTLRRLIVVGPSPVGAAAREQVECQVVPDRKLLLANVRNGMAAAGTERVLYLTADLPLLRSEMIDEFVERALAVEADLAAAVVRRDNLGDYRTGKPFICLADGEFQHGNLFMIPRASLGRQRFWRPLDRLYRARKSGLATAAVLGPALLWWFAWDVMLLHRPTLQQAAERVSRTVRLRVVPVESSYPEVMLDIDEAEDYEYVVEALAQPRARPARGEA